MKFKKLMNYLVMMFFLLLIILMALPVAMAMQELGKPVKTSERLVNEFERERAQTFHNQK